MATVPQGNGKGKAVTVPSNLQTRTAVEAHLADGRIGREMLRTEEAVRQAKLSEIGNAPAPAPMPPPRPRVTQSAADKAVALRNATHDYYKTKFPFKEVHELFSREWIPGGPDPYKREYGWGGHQRLSVCALEVVRYAQAAARHGVGQRGGQAQRGCHVQRRPVQPIQGARADDAGEQRVCDRH